MGIVYLAYVSITDFVKNSGKINIEQITALFTLWKYNNISSSILFLIKKKNPQSIEIAQGGQDYQKQFRN